MRELKKEFVGCGEVKGIKFKQLRKSNFAYMYEVDSGCSIYYEVFHRKVNRKFNHEIYPRAKHFSKWAWTCMSFDKAIKKFNSLNKIENAA